jgi:hypothetical protein
MPATPNIVLTATLDDLTGAAAGSTANPAKLRIALCGYGPVLPKIAGTAMLAKTGPFTVYSSGAGISTPLWGNDQITPGNTFYTIELLDGEDNVVQCGAYALTGVGTQDLSNAVPIIPQGGPQMFNIVCNKLNGNVPGTVFTIPTPMWGSILLLLYRGAGLRPPTDANPDYTVNGQTVTTNFTATAGGELYALYVQALS